MRALFDADSDGDPDILIANENPFDPASGGQNRLLLNSGDCTSSYIDHTELLPQLIDQTQGFRPADLDGDGDTDLVVLSIGPNYVLRNQLVETGTPNFVQEFSIGPAEVNVSSTRNGLLVDVNGDGDLDLVEANSRNEPDRIYLGDGTGSFNELPGGLPALEVTHTDVDAADLDGDGDQDLYFTSPGDFQFGHGFLGGQNRFFMNEGSGVFTEATLPSFPARIATSTDSSFEDVDGDGDLDLLVAASGAGPLGDPAGGLDRLYIQYDCASDPAQCIQLDIDRMREVILALDPAGDEMTGNDPEQNEERRAALLSWVEVMQEKLDSGKLAQISPHLKKVGKRVDGQGGPPDWVAGQAAGQLLALVEHTLGILNGCL